MNTYLKNIQYAFVGLLLAIVGFAALPHQASAYYIKLGGVTVNINHCNQDGNCHDLSERWGDHDQFSLLSDAIANVQKAIKNGGYYHVTLSCGNTVTLSVACKAGNICKGGDLYSQSKRCQLTKTQTCANGCTAGACNSGTGGAAVTPTAAVAAPDPASCTADVWDCGDWSACSVAGSQSRSCHMTFNCPNAVTSSPALAQSCTLDPSCAIHNTDGTCVKPTISDLSENPTFISKGGSCNLTWTSQNATKCTLTTKDPMTGNDVITDEPVNRSAKNGTQKSTGALNKSQLYTLTCYNGDVRSELPDHTVTCAVSDESEQ